MKHVQYACPMCHPLDAEQYIFSKHSVGVFFTKQIVLQNTCSIPLSHKILSYILESMNKVFGILLFYNIKMIYVTW